MTMNEDKCCTSMINHPMHYNRENAIECIDEMELVFGAEATATFCLLNCWKYRYRAGLKNDGFEDIEKSDWYIRKYKELREKISSADTSHFTISEISNKNSLPPNNISIVPCANK